MFNKILIANRGEIALRVICACKELGVKTVAVYSDADRNSLHVRFADEAICIGPPRSSESYLNIPAVISAAEITNVDAIHPGYGLLSENANFAEVCETSGLKFIGPPPEVIRLMGEKEKARQAMQKAQVPILPGSDGVISSAEEAREWAQRIGYPVIERPRHIEFQVIGDNYGKVISLGERECSIQRRHQKLLEEAPSTRVTDEMRQQIGRKLESCLSEIGYVNAGTVEFLMDEDGSLHFIEMNTRIQVEHPVTELVTGIDLVKTQILIATGAKISEIIPKIERTGLRGHALECRINAEHPEKFTPSAGKIKTFHVPGGLGVRVDTAAYAEGVIPPYYDSLIAKLITYGKDREEAIMRMKRALEMFIVEGIYTTIPLHRQILEDEEFKAGNIDTKFMERFFARQQERRAKEAAQSG